MDVNLDKKHEHQLRELAESSGRTVSEVLEAIVIEGLEQQLVCRAQTSLAQAKSTVERIRALPMEGPDDNFSGRDHDQVLYPSDK